MGYLYLANLRTETKQLVKKGKGKASSLDTAPLTVLDSGTTTSEVAADWQ